MSALKEFANFITLNMANLATTYARLVAEGGQGYEALPANNRVASGRRLLKAVVEAFELETATPLIDISNKNLTENQSPNAGSEPSSSQGSGNITLPNPLLEVECLGQTLTPVVTNLEAGKFLWQILSETRTAVLGNGIDVTTISGDVTKRKHVEDRLNKRVQELNCLNEIGREMEEMPPVAELLPWVSERIPRAMQYPELCQTAIEFEDEVYGQAEAIDLPAQMTHGLYIKGEVLGRIYIAYAQKHDFLDEESAMLGAIATRLSGYIENRRLLEETEAALAETETLAREQVVLTELGQALTARLSVDEVLEEMYRQTSRLIDTSNYYIGLYDSEKEEISFRFDVSESEIDRTITIMPASQGIAGYMIRTRTSLLFEDNVRARQEALGIKMVGEEPKSWLGVPLIVGDQAVGAMAVQSFTTPGLYGAHDRELLTAIANQMAVAIQNARQFEETEATLTDVQQSQALLRTIIDSTPDWIFIKDHEHRYRLANRAYAESMKSSPEEFIGKNDLELGFPEDIVKGNPDKGIRGFWPDDLEVMESGQTKIIDVEPAEVDGQPVYLSTIKAPLRDSEGNVWAVLGYVRDITDREQLLAQVEQRARRGQTIREITDKMRAATSLEQLIKTAATELGERLSAGHALVELGLTGTVTEDQRPNGAGSDGPAIGKRQ